MGMLIATGLSHQRLGVPIGIPPSVFNQVMSSKEKNPLIAVGFLRCTQREN